MLKAMLAALILVPSLVFAAKFEAGTHYEVLPTPQTAQPEVVEFFSFLCPHCKSFEPLVQKLEQSLPKGQTLIRNHVDFLGGVPADFQSALGRVFFVADNAGVGHQFADALFAHIHVKRAGINSMDDLRALALSAGVPALVYDSNIASAKVNAQVDAIKARQNFYSEQKVLRGVPSLIVNGKYQVLLGGLNAENPQQDLNELVAYLLNKKS